MKRIIYFLVVMALFALSACEEEKDPIVLPSGDISIDATSSSTWHYYSFEEEEVIGSGEEDSATNAAWFARDDWDIAIKRYNVRTNSGPATSIGSKGGVHTCDEGITFESLESVPSDATFEVDEVVTVRGHGGSVSQIIQSTAQVIQFQKNPDGSLVMPPVYLPSPVYIFKTADGEKTFKVNFTQYKNEGGESGHVKFDFAQIN
jgi:predicted small lipoprotein YifL